MKEGGQNQVVEVNEKANNIQRGFESKKSQTNVIKTTCFLLRHG